METALVTGASSFIGSAVVRELASRSIRVLAVVRNRQSDTSSFADLPGVTVLFCDLKGLHHLPAMIQEPVDVFYHFAWDGSYRKFRADYALQLSNVKFALDSISACARMGTRRYVGVGSIAEFDCFDYCSEDGSAPLPSSCYGSAKVAAKLMAKAECCRLGIDLLWTQPASVYGPGDKSDNFINLAIRLLDSQERASFTRGEQLYDFFHVSDAAKAFYLVGSRGRPFHTYYLGSSDPRPLKEYILELRDAVNPGKDLFFGDLTYRGAFMTRAQLDCSKLIEHTGYRPTLTFREGIRDPLFLSGLISRESAQGKGSASPSPY